MWEKRKTFSFARRHVGEKKCFRFVFTRRYEGVKAKPTFVGFFFYFINLPLNWFHQVFCLNWLIIEIAETDVQCDMAHMLASCQAARISIKPIGDSAFWIFGYCFKFVFQIQDIFLKKCKLGGFRFLVYLEVIYIWLV